MKKLKSLLPALVVVLCLTASPIARAGDIPVGGFVEQQGTAPEGYAWQLISELWYLMPLF